MDEFALIRRFFRRDVTRSDVVLGVGDDAALLQTPAGTELAISTDTMVEGVHFPAGAPAHAIGWRALATNLSDLAAMGATPAWATLALTLPQADEAWLQEFARGFFELADRFGVALVGGDVTQGALTVTVTIHGHVPAGAALRRSGAKPGDRVFVTGKLGGAAAGLAAYPNDGRGRYLYPQPRVAEGVALRGFASAAIDISDGLVADLGHIAEASGVGAQMALEKVPQAPELLRFNPDKAFAMALAGGDDYELCFTIEPKKLDDLRARWRPEWTPLSDIGMIDSGEGVRCVKSDGSMWVPAAGGYRHF